MSNRRPSPTSTARTGRARRLGDQLATAVSGDPQRLAPDVDPAWVDAFVLEQRLNGVPGPRIGDALAVVQGHVAESGESAQETFGDATEYARAAAPAGADVATSRLGGGFVVGLLVGLIGMLLVNLAAAAGSSGGPDLSVTPGLIILFVVPLSLGGLLLGVPRAGLAFVVHRPWLTWVGLMLLMALLVGAALLWPDPVVQLPRQPVLVLGLVLLALGTLLLALDQLRGDVEDPVVGPGEDRPRGTWLGWLTVVMMPLATLLLLGMNQLLSRLPDLFR